LTTLCEEEVQEVGEQEVGEQGVGEMKKQDLIKKKEELMEEICKQEVTKYRIMNSRSDASLRHNASSTVMNASLGASKHDLSYNDNSDTASRSSRSTASGPGSGRRISRSSRTRLRTSDMNLERSRALSGSLPPIRSGSR
jgi:hypothetical protein